MKYLMLISQKHSIAATIDSNVIDIIYVDELEMYKVVMRHYVTYSVRPGLLLNSLYLALIVKL